MPLNMTGVAALALIAGAITPFLAALFTSPGMSPTHKRLISGSIAVVLGFISAIITGQFGWISPNIVTWVTTFVVSAGIVIVAAQGFYKQFKGMIEKVEVSTTKDGYVPEVEPALPTDPEEVGDDEIVVEVGAAPEGEDPEEVGDDEIVVEEGAAPEGEDR